MEIRLELIILLAVIFVIMITHTLCGCSRVGLLEGLDTLTSQVTMAQKKTNVNTKQVPSSQMMGSKKE